MAVRSKQLAEGRLTSTSFVTIYTCPTGSRTICKGIWMRNQSITAENVFIHIGPSASGRAAFRIYLGGGGFNGDSYASGEQWQVLMPDQTIEIALETSGTVDYLFSGAELVL